jgi:3-methyladenine DNA glycosylase Tag
MHRVISVPEKAMEAPARIEPAKLADYLDVMSKAVFQSGISWNVVEKRWPGIKAALADFDPETVADFTPIDIDRLMQDDRVIRNRKKLEAIAFNARTMVELDRTHGGFERYLASLGDFEPVVADLKRRFKFLGDFGCYYFLCVVGEPVPPHDEWRASRGRN